MDAYEETGGNVIGVEECAWEDVSSYGVVVRGEGPDTGFAIDGMVEKPKRDEAPSNLFISGRYLLQPEIFTLLAEQTKGAGGEIQLTDAMQVLMKSQSFSGVKYDGKVFDCGSKLGFLTANVVFALDRDDIREGFLKELRKLDLDAASVQLLSAVAAE
jgi:UTP--glucose-1-phosphate uridylyltransferase